MTPYQLGFIHGNNGSSPKSIYDDTEENKDYQNDHEAGKTNASIVAKQEIERFADYVKQK